MRKRDALTTLALGTALAAQLLAAIPVLADEARVVGKGDLGAFAWRPIGPANMGGRVSAIALVPGSRTDFYVGFATGGVFRTRNQGTTFSEVFRNEATSSIGAIAVADAPANWAGWEAAEAELDSAALATPRSERGKGRVVWIGTGEGNGRNSSSWGHGVYRSVDGGASFQHLGLEESHDIPALAVDPRDPEVAFVAALGHLWGPNPERGVYRTNDGGENWERILGEGDAVGACDVVIDPQSPATIYAALYERRRQVWSFSGVSDNGGIFRSDDGGGSWTKLSEGLPERTGRIGLTVFAANPDIVYAVIESDQGGTGKTAWADRSPAGGLFRSEDRGASWVRVNQLNFRPFYFSRVALDPEDDQRVYMPGWHLAISDDGGYNFRRSGSLDVHVDHHAIVINPQDPRNILLGNDGGIYLSHDRAASWDFLNHIDLGQFYHVDVDMATPYRVGGGLQDNGSWVGPSATNWRTGQDPRGGITNADWQPVNGGDGFRVAFDPTNPNIVYATSQGGELKRIHLDTGYRVSLKAAPDEGAQKLRFNWDAPFVISAFDQTVLYHAGNQVFKLTERGDFWYAISDDLTRQETDKVWAEGSDAEAYGTISALAESPLQQGTLWAGSDDGLIHVTTDEGASWRDVTPDAVGGLYVAHLEASRADARTAYAAIDGHRSDDFSPIVLMTEDVGGKWRNIAGDLPVGSPVRVVRELPGNPQALFCGTEQAAYLSVDRGAHWLKLDGLPTVPVYDLVIHPRELDMVAGTHGRSVWIMDDLACLSELTAELAQEDLHLFACRATEPRLSLSRGYGGGARRFVGKNPPPGANITYWLKERPEKPKASIAIVDAAGVTLRELKGPTEPGLNRLQWDLKADEKHAFKRAGEEVFVAPGTYTVKVTVAGETRTTSLEVGPAPNWMPPEERGKLPPARP